MRLSRYRVTDFRSVRDSGWIEIDDVTALIGVNESGKTNLLLPLWKFRPAQEGEIIPTADYPKKMFGEIRKAPEKYKFIEVEFDCTDEAAEFAQKSGYPGSQMGRLVAGRRYDGNYFYSFPDAVPERSVPAADMKPLLDATVADLESLTPLKGEAELRDQLVAAIGAADPGANPKDAQGLKAMIAAIIASIPQEPMKTSVIVPRVNQLVDDLRAKIQHVSKPIANAKEGMWDIVWAKLPKFVYYSNYGNLDSEIYLPHVVENLERDDLGAKEAAKARTLRVLFRFVGLEPHEILELGKEFLDETDPDREPTVEEVEEIATKKKERSILLQSAGAKLTEEFRNWWNQGNYRFRFEADGNHFRIWVSDDLRHEEIELENRSTGLQWFLSFYLVFLVESLGEHADAFLLLDEPGLSLHPLAQRDLSVFFENLSGTNQLIYTTHSPFLIDADYLDRARKVFVNDAGLTECSPDLRANSDKQLGASYAVYSALNLSVSESLLLGCKPTIVEGPSDQHYLSATKTLLIGGKKLSPSRELVFPPSGGAKTAKAIAGMLSGRSETLPKMLLDGDTQGVQFANSAKSSLYTGDKERVRLATDFVDVDHAEIEDLMATSLIVSVVDRRYRADLLFEDEFKDGQAIIPQIEAWAASQGVLLDEGWKVEVAKDYKRLALSRGLDSIPNEVTNRWVKLFEWIAE